ncbi:MAG TPA: beta-propeller fold lactonase family protein [Terriglobales bacterium]|nr:beta-propeller fold lactonase family protein [Terriglobales bacterium]
MLTRIVGLMLLFFAAIPALAQTTGAIYLNTNQASNEVWTYTRASDGTLTFAGSFPTQGAGSAAGDLESQGAILLSPNGKLLFVVNAGSNEISSFAVKPGGQLTFVAKVPSGGTFPVSLTLHASLLYALNAGGTTARINGFKVNSNGTLKAIAGSARRLSAALPTPTQIGFNAAGTLLVVTEKDTNKIDTYTVAANGLATGPNVQNSSGPGPFGFAYDSAGRLIVSEVKNSAASSYSVDSAGVLTVITASLIDFGKAACWTVNTNSRRFPNQYSYITNTADATISGFKIASDGSLSLLDADGRTFVLPTGGDPLDEALSSDSRYLYVLEGSYGGLVGFQIQSDGSLVQVTNPLGTPTSSYGLAGN